METENIQIDNAGAAVWPIIDKSMDLKIDSLLVFHIGLQLGELPSPHPDFEQRLYYWLMKDYRAFLQKHNQGLPVSDLTVMAYIKLRIIEIEKALNCSDFIAAIKVEFAEEFRQLQSYILMTQGRF